MVSQERVGLLERGLRWDEHFNRRLGVIATGAAVGLAAINAPVLAAYTALFAGGNFAVAELEKRLIDPLTQHRLGEKAVKKSEFGLAA